MLLPDGPEVEGRIDNRAVFNCLETAYPSKSIEMVALQELSDRERPKLLEGLRKKRVEIACKIIALAGLDRIAAKLENMVIAAVRQFVPPLWRLPSARRRGRPRPRYTQPGRRRPSPR